MYLSDVRSGTYLGVKLRIQQIDIFFFVAQQLPVCQGLLIHEFSSPHKTTHHSRYKSSGRVISSLQRPLPDNTKHSQQTDIHAPVGFEPTTWAGEQPKTYLLDRAANGTDNR
jgi:hypothetical protein